MYGAYGLVGSISEMRADIAIVIASSNKSAFLSLSRKASTMNGFALCGSIFKLFSAISRRTIPDYAGQISTIRVV